MFYKILQNIHSFKVRAMSAGVDNLIKIDEEIRKRDKNIGDSTAVDTSKSQWRRGELQFEAYMRMLDSRVSG